MSSCLAIALVVAQLADRAGERPLLARGIKDGPQVVLFVNPETGAWTDVLVDKQGCAKIVFYGDTLEPAPRIGNPA